MSEPLAIPAATPRPQRAWRPTRPTPRRFDLPAATPRTVIAGGTRRRHRPAELCRAPHQRPAAPAARHAAAREAASPAALSMMSLPVAETAVLSPSSRRSERWSPTRSRTALLRRAAPAMLFGGVRDLASLAATWTPADRDRSSAVALDRRAAIAVRHPVLTSSTSAAGAGAGRLRTAGRAASRAGWLPPSAGSGVAYPSERVEAAAERTGAAVADAVVATFERLIPSIVARALDQAERRLMSAI